MAIKRKLNIRNERVKVTAHFHEQGSVLSGSASGFCDGFEIEISIDSDLPETAVSELMRLAHQMCFTEVALGGKIPLSLHHTHNGQPLDLAAT